VRSKPPHLRTAGPISRSCYSGCKLAQQTGVTPTGLSSILGTPTLPSLGSILSQHLVLTYRRNHHIRTARDASAHFAKNTAYTLENRSCLCCRAHAGAQAQGFHPPLHYAHFFSPSSETAAKPTGTPSFSPVVRPRMPWQTFRRNERSTTSERRTQNRTPAESRTHTPEHGKCGGFGPVRWRAFVRSRIGAYITVQNRTKLNKARRLSTV
jgi:hypothetical protein